MASTTYRLFLSTPSARRATQHLCRCPAAVHHFYPRPPRGGRRFIPRSSISLRKISIHALREEGDAHGCLAPFRHAISIHALREEGDAASTSKRPRPSPFLSTPSARRATHYPEYRDIKPVNFYPRPPRGGRRILPAVQLADDAISIHALREEGDAVDFGGGKVKCDFYPRPPRGGRHTSRRHRQHRANFYPRPPRGGRPTNTKQGNEITDFYPRPPRGGRPGHEVDLACSGLFLSTPSARRATEREVFAVVDDRISIHALREEGDAGALNLVTHDLISIHALREEGDACARPKLGTFSISIHALREEGDGCFGESGSSVTYFYPRPPRGGRPLCILALQHRVGFLSTPSARRATLCLPLDTDAMKNFYPRPPRGGRP